MSNVKVSIIVPVYHVEKYLIRCVNSLINQTLKEIEIILVDDGSPDACPNICDKLALQDSRIQVIHKINGGLGFARNSGIEMATGEFIAFVDSDDYVDLNMFDCLYTQVKSDRLDTVFCGFHQQDSNHNIHSISEVNATQVFQSQNEIQAFLLDMIGTLPSYKFDRKYQMSVWHALYARDIIEKNSIRFYSEKEFISEDIIFHIDYLTHSNRLGIIPEPLYYYCDNAQSSLSNSFREDRFNRYIILYQEICNRLPLTETRIRASRLFIGYTRSLIFRISHYHTSIFEKYALIKSISSNSIWNTIAHQYEYKRLPIFQKIIFILLLKRINVLLLVISSLKKYI